jgi:hypothetical protein
MFFAYKIVFLHSDSNMEALNQNDNEQQITEK